MDLKSTFKKNQGFLAFIFLVLVFRSSFADQYVVPSGSMKPTIQIGDRILTNKMAYDLQVPFSDISIVSISEPERGDIVVFENPESGITMVKRLIGLPGDEITVSDGSLFLNGTMISRENDLKENPETIDGHTFTTQRTYERVRMGAETFNVPQGHYFMMGDNRENSLDSRYWGFVPREKLLGKALRVTFSANIFQLSPDVDFQRWGKSLY